MQGGATGEPWRVLYSGSTDGKRQQGVAIAVCQSACKALFTFNPISPRLITATFHTLTTPVTIVQAYAPTNAASTTDTLPSMISFRTAWIASLPLTTCCSWGTSMPNLDSKQSYGRVALDALACQVLSVTMASGCWTSAQPTGLWLQTPCSSTNPFTCIPGGHLMESPKTTLTMSSSSKGRKHSQGHQGLQRGRCRLRPCTPHFQNQTFSQEQMQTPPRPPFPNSPSSH